jgi:hypothetical protein
MERANLYMGLVRRNIEMAPMRILGFRRRLCLFVFATGLQHDGQLFKAMLLAPR